MATVKDKPDVLLRAKSVSLSKRPHSQYERKIRSADSNRLRYADKQLYYKSDNQTFLPRCNVKQKKLPLKVPFNISIQNLSIPMAYADNMITHSTSKRNSNYNIRSDNRAKYSNPKQVGERKLCHSASGNETENKLLLQISEAEQVSDFERILNSNAILSEHAHGHVWRGYKADLPPSAALLPRPRSTYSLQTVSQVYHYLFYQHEENLQPLIEKYRENKPESNKSSLLDKNWFEHLQNLSEFYEDDQILHKEIESITDRIVAEEVRSVDAKATKNNFNVNLSGLIGLNINGEGVPSSSRDELGVSPDLEKIETTEDREWLALSMTDNFNERQQSQGNSTIVDCLAQNLNKIEIDCNKNVPKITFSNCCDAATRNDSADKTDVVIHLAVPSIDSINESRPPMM